MDNLDALYDAAIARDADAIAKLEMEADRLNEDKQTILHIESANGNTKRVRFIVRQFANKNILVKQDNEKCTALCWAAYFGHTKVAKVLIDAARRLPPSANDNPVTSFQAFLRHVDEDSETALYTAVKRGHLAVAKLLAEADPTDRHIKNYRGKTPIYIAAENGYFDIVKMLCTACTPPYNLDGPGTSTALHAAIMNLHQEQEEDKKGNILKEEDKDVITTLINAVKLSREEHKRGNILKEEVKDVIMTLINAVKLSNNANPTSDQSFEAFFNKTDKYDRTILELAVKLNAVDLIELILAEDPAYRRGNKKKNLMRLIKKAIDAGHMNIVKLLTRDNRASIDGPVDLFLAMKKQDKEYVLELLENKKELVIFADEEGWTPLHYAAYHRFDSVLQDIKRMQEAYGNFYELQYPEGVLTSFHLAAEKGYTSTLMRLMQLWPDSSLAYTAVNKNGQNILHLAATQNNKEMIWGILEHCPKIHKNAIVNRGDGEGNTPLHILASNGCYTPELIKHEGLDVKRENNERRTPHDMLYSDIEIIADQVRIKIALDFIESNKSGKFGMKFWWKGVKEIKHNSEVVPAAVPEVPAAVTEVPEVPVVPLSMRARKDAKFTTARKLLMDEKYSQKKKDLEPYKNRANTQIIVTALITTVTFTVGFTMPGGLRQSGEDEGSAVLSKKKAFNACMVSDALALLLSTSSLFFYFLQSMNEDPHRVSILNAASTVLNIFSIIAMMLTFITGTYVVLFHSQTLAITICTIGSFFFLLLIIALMIKVVHGCLAIKRNID